MQALKVSAQDAEYWYGDKNLASKMQKEELTKEFHCGLSYLCIGGPRSALTNLGLQFKPK
jgi:hypothetical protein